MVIRQKGQGRGAIMVLAFAVLALGLLVILFVLTNHGGDVMSKTLDSIFGLKDIVQSP